MKLYLSDQSKLIMNLHRKETSSLIFLSLLFYLLLRAYFVAPLHDEVATYFHYIESGDYFSRTMILDANNHVLNSFLCRIIYRIHDGHFFWFRIPNLLAFILYFWACRTLLSEIESKLTNMLILLALTSTPFVLEYFAFCRGYGLGLAFFVSSLVFVKRFIHDSHAKNLFLSLLLITLSIYSNLIFINSFLLTILLIGIIQVIKRKQFSSLQTSIHILFFFVFLIASLPVFALSFALKKGGALYYGSLEGIWDVTGKSLVEHTLFTSSELWMWILLLLGVFLFIFAIFKLFSLKSIPIYFLKTEHLLIYFLLGNILASIFLATVMNVNYPEDRAAIHLIPLTLLTIGLLLYHLDLSYVNILFLFFPLSLVFNLNLSTSIVTPDQRLNPDFYSRLRNEIKDKNIAVYTTSALNWAYYERSHSTQKLTQSRQDVDTSFEYIMTRKTLFEKIIDPKTYQLFALEPYSQTYVFKRIKPFKIHKQETKIIQEYWGKDEFIPVYEQEMNPDEKFKLHQVDIQGKMLIDSAYNNISLVFTTENDKNETIFYDSFQLRWFFGARKLDFDFKGNATFPAYKGVEKKIKIYIWNPFHRVVKFSKGKIKLSYF